MPADSFQLRCLTRVLAEDAELTEALGLPEVSALEDPDKPGRPILAAKAQALLEDMELAPALSLHRRRVTDRLEADSLELEFKPPRRNPAWETPVRIVVHFVRWSEGGRHQAYIPAIGAHVCANRPNQLRQHVEEHVRLLLATDGEPLGLARLERLARIRELRVEELTIQPQRPTPRQLAAAGASPKDKAGVLNQLAEELPPSVTTPAEPGRKGTRTAAAVDAAHGLEGELRQLADQIADVHRRSLLIVAPPGTGKTTLVRELARRRAEFGLAHTAFWSTSAARLMSGPIGFGMWQERCQNLCREIARARAILHLGNLAELAEVGKVTREGQSIAGFLRPWIARGDVFAIAEITPEQLAALGRTEPNLLSTFQSWPLRERSPEETRALLEAIWNAAPGKLTQPAGHTRAALDRLHLLHQRYATYSANPGRPVRFLRNLLADRFPDRSIGETDVLAAFSRETGLPAVLLDDDVPLALDDARDWFSQRVIGQPAAVERLLDLLALVKARLARPRKPLASFLFIGPTGTGKTEMARATAEFLFGDASRMVRFDLNEFADPISVQRLVGGAVTPGGEGLLTARVREQPFSVLLLDEFEKADPSFFDLLLQILGDGRLTDGAGRVADFCNCVIIMTSNLGAQGFHSGPVGFRTQESRRAEAGDHFSDAVRRFLRPEIYNRMDAIVPFLPLDHSVVLRIAHRHLDEIRRRDGLRYRPIELTLDETVARELAAEGYDLRYGARPLRRSIARTLLVPLAEALNHHPRETPLHAEVRWERGRPAVLVRPVHADPRPRTASRGETEPVPGAEAELAQAIVRLRRRTAAIGPSTALSRIEDEISLLEAAERRQAARKTFEPASRARLERCRAIRASVLELQEEARRLESDLLLPLYQRQAVQTATLASRLGELKNRLLHVTRSLFKAQVTDPDRVVLAFLAEPREWLASFAGAYHRLAQQTASVTALSLFVPRSTNRRSSLQLNRLPLDHPQRWPDPFPENAWGVAFEVQGDLALPRLAPEAGLHIAREGRQERVAWIQAGQKDLDAFILPERIEQPGRIRSLGGDVCRTHLPLLERIKDSRLGERPCTEQGWEAALRLLVEERLHRQVEEATGGRPT